MADYERRMSWFSIWWLAARPKTLWAAVAPVLIGTGLAHGDGGFHLLTACAALLGALLIQVGTNFCNDYADFKKGADTAERTGPLRVTQAGLVSPQTMWRATFLVFALFALIGVYFVVRGGWPMMALVLISIIAGVAYTAGPYALAYLGLGDVFVLIFFGPVAVGGTYYLQTLQLPFEILVAGIAPGLLSCAILAVNNLRDVEQDRAASKRTLAVRWGRTFARWEYTICMLTGLWIVPVLLVWGFDRTPWLLLGSVGTLAAIQPLNAVWRGPVGPALNPVLGQTAKVLLIFAACFTGGQLLGTF